MRKRFASVAVMSVGVVIGLGACTVVQEPATPVDREEHHHHHHHESPGAAGPAAPGPGASNPGGTTPSTRTPAQPRTPAEPTPGEPATPAEPGATVPTPPAPGATKIPPPKKVEVPDRKDPPGKESPPRHGPPRTPPQGLADGASCSTGSQCASGICEGMGCGPNQGKCVPAQRACTRDLVLFCGCDGKEFRASSRCPGRVFRHPGACNPDR